MSHLSDLQCSMAADDALPGADFAEARSHLESCDACQARVSGFTHEKRLIRTSLLIDDEAVTIPTTLPRFKKPLSLRDFAFANVATGLTLWTLQFLWKSLFGELVIDAITRFTSIDFPDVLGLVIDGALYFLGEGTTMIDIYLGFIVLTLFGLGLTWAVVSGKKRHSTLSLCLAAIVCSGVVAPPSANALEHRHGRESITISASEVIDDTLIVAGETIIMEGAIKGDLIALGQRVIISGSVAGNLITAAEHITIEGKVGGMVLSAGSSVELKHAFIGGDFWGFGEDVEVDRDSTISRNATMAAESISVAGNVTMDVFGFGESVEINGRIGRNLEAYSKSVTLLSNTRIGGDVRFHTDEEEQLRQSPEANVTGEVQFLDIKKEFTSQNRYTTGKFYLHQILHLVSAFAVGFFLLWIFPALRAIRLEGGVEGLKTAGIGLIAIISMPVIALLVAVTIIGIPFTLMGLVAWILLLYLAKIALASTIGEMLLSSTERSDSLPLTLFVGLSLTMVAINLPGIGGVINFLLTIMGAGMIVHMVFTRMADRNAGYVD